MKYFFRARKETGEEVSGERDALDQLALSRSLRAEGLTPILAKAVTPKKNLADSILGLFVKALSLREKVLFADNLGSMITAGLSLSRALEVIERQGGSKHYKEVVHTIAERVKSGGSLHEALSARKDIFPPVFVAMVAAGEESGKLPESLAIISDQLNKSYELRRKIKGAMMYPAVIVCVIILIGILMMMYVVPTLTATFKDLGVELPLTTQMVIWFSDFVSAHKILSILLLPLLIVGGWRGAKFPVIRRSLERLVLRLPLISPMVRNMNAAVTMRTISSLVSSGVSMTESLQITEDVLQNHAYKKALVHARENVQKGIPLSQTFHTYEQIYPVLVTELAAVGEETGDLPGMLLKGAQFYEKEVDQVTKNLSTIIEPVLMVLIGIAVGFFAIAMLGPMYSLTDAIK